MEILTLMMSGRPTRVSKNIVATPNVGSASGDNIVVVDKSDKNLQKRKIPVNTNNKSDQKTNTPGKPDPVADIPDDMPGQVSYIVQLLRENTPKINSLYTTVLDSKDCLVQRINNLHTDVYEAEGRIEKRFKQVEERYSKTFDKGEKVHTHVLGDGGLDSKFHRLSEKFYNKNTGLQACSKVVFDDALGLDASS